MRATLPQMLSAQFTHPNALRCSTVSSASRKEGEDGNWP